MGNIRVHSFCIKQNGSSLLTLNLSGSDFSQEKAIITVEIYRKDTWRINTIARGFNGGLGDLLRNYGGEEITDTNSGTLVQNNPAQNTQTVSLEKKLSKDAPQLVSLAKPIKVQLAVQFDDYDGELDFWYYGSKLRRMDSVNMKGAVYRHMSYLSLMMGLGHLKKLNRCSQKPQDILFSGNL